MKLGTIKILGKEYVTCFSLRVVKAVTERYGGVSDMAGALTPADDSEASVIAVMDESLWVLTTMMEAGYRHAKREGLDALEPPTMDELLDGCDLSDLGTIKAGISETMSDNSERSVEAVPSKKDDTTQDS